MKIKDRIYRDVVFCFLLLLSFSLILVWVLIQIQLGRMIFSWLACVILVPSNKKPEDSNLARYNMAKTPASKRFQSTIVL